MRQVLQQSLQLFAKRKSVPTLVAGITLSLRPSRSKLWALWTRQLANSLPIWEERSPQPQAMRGKELSVLQRVSVLVQRYNAVLLHDTLPATDCTDWWSVPNCVLSSFLNPPGTYLIKNEIIIIIIKDNHHVSTFLFLRLFVQWSVCIGYFSTQLLRIKCSHSSFCASF